MAKLERYTGSEIAREIGVVRLDGDLTAGTRALIQGTQQLAETANAMVNHAEAQYIAGFQLDQRKKATEVQLKHQNDPEAFRKEWQGHAEGTLSAVPAAFRVRAQLSLKAAGESGYEDVLTRTAAQTKKNATDTWAAELKLKENDYLAKAAGAQKGQYSPDVVEQARVAYSLHLEDGVRLKVMDEKAAALYRDQLVTKSNAEALGEEAKRRYFDALGRPAKAGEPDLDRALSVVRQAESGNQYGITGPKVEYRNKKGEVRVDYPYGAYQIMGANIPSWTKEVLGKSMTPEEFVKDRDAQDKVARAKFGQFVKEHGVENAFAIWASGRPLAQSGEDRDLVFKTKVKDTVAARMKMYGDTQATPQTRARDAANGVLDELRTDPAFASLRPETSAATIEARVRRAISDAEADYTRAKLENNESYNTFIARLSRGLEVDVGEAQKRGEEARRLGDSKSASRWDMVATKGQALASFSALPFRDQAADLQAAYAKAQANPKDDSALFEYETKQQMFARAQTAMKQDSFTYSTNVYGRDLPPPAQVDFTKADAAAFKARRDIVAAVEPRVGMEVLPFSQEEMGRFASTWNAAAAVDRTRLAAALNDGLGPKLAARVFGTLSKDGNVDRATVFAAGIADRDPVLAREVYEGLDVLRTEKGAAKFKDEDAQRAFNDYTGTAFYADRAGHARDGAYEASKALMALWAKNNGKLGEEIPPDQARKIIERVVGPVLRHNNHPVFPPRRDMDQRGFDTMLSRIRDQDAPKLTAGDGSEMTITHALRTGQLVSYGDGKYIIRFGDRFLTRPDDPRRPFVLDRAFFEGVARRVGAEEMGEAFTGNKALPRINPESFRGFQ